MLQTGYQHKYPKRPKVSHISVINTSVLNQHPNTTNTRRQNGSQTHPLPTHHHDTSMPCLSAPFRALPPGSAYLLTFFYHFLLQNRITPEILEISLAITLISVIKMPSFPLGFGIHVIYELAWVGKLSGQILSCLACRISLLKGKNKKY